MNPTELNSLQFEDVRNNAVNNTTENAATNAQASKSVGINVSAAYSYLSVLTGEQSKLSDEMKQAQSTLQRYVASLAYEPERAENANPAPATKPLLDLVTRVVLRDINLQEQIANDLTSRIKIVKTGEAVDELKSYCDTLPKVFQESNDAGKALMRYLCEVVVNLSTADNISPATSRQLAQENIFAPDGVLTPKGEQTLTKLLSATMDFIVANQPDVLSSIGRESAMVISPSANKMQIAEFIQTAIEDMPDDNTYMNIFSKNSNNFEDETSAEIAKRVSELINKAASIAREGRLIDGKNSFDEAVSSRELAQRADSAQKQVESEQNSQQAELSKRQEIIDRLAKEISDRDEALERQEAQKTNSRQTSTISDKTLPPQNTTQQSVPQQTMSADSVSKLKEALAEANIDSPKSYQNPNVLREAVAKTMVDSITGNRFTYPENEQLANKGYAGAQDENIDLIDEYEKFSLPVDNSAKPLADRPTSDEDVKINNVLSAAAARAKEGRLLDNNSRLDNSSRVDSRINNTLPENVKRAADSVNFTNNNSNPTVNNNTVVNSNTVAPQSGIQTQQPLVQPTEQQQYASSQEPEIESSEPRVQPQQPRITDDIARSLQNIDDEDIQNTRLEQPKVPKVRVEQQVYNKADDIDFDVPKEQLRNNTEQTQQSSVQPQQPSVQTQQPLVQPTEQQQYASSQEPEIESSEPRVQPQQSRIADDIARALQNIDDEDIQNTRLEQPKVPKVRVEHQVYNKADDIDFDVPKEQLRNNTEQTQQSSVQPQQPSVQTQQPLVQPTEQQQYASSQKPEIESSEPRVQPQQSRIADDIARALQNIDDEDIQNTRLEQPKVRVEQQVYNKADDIDFDVPKEQLRNNTEQTQQSSVQPQQPSVQTQQPLVQPTEQQQYASSQEPEIESYEQRVQPQQSRIADDIARALQNIDDEDIQITRQNQNQTQNLAQAPREERVTANRFIAPDLPKEQEEIEVGDKEAFIPKKEFVSKDNANVPQRELQRESTIQRETVPQRDFIIALDDVDDELSTTNSNKPVITNNMNNNIGNTIGNTNERLFDTDTDIEIDTRTKANANVNTIATTIANANSNADTDIDDAELNNIQTEEFSNDRQFAFRPEFTNALNNIDKEDGVKPSVDENDEDELMFSRARNSAAPFAAPIWEQETDLSVPNNTDNEDVDTNISLDKGNRDAFADIENMPPFMSSDTNKQALEQPERNTVLTAEADLPDFKSEAERSSNISVENRNEQPKLNQAAMETIRRSLDATDNEDLVNNKPSVSVNAEIANQNQRANVEPSVDAVKANASQASVLQNKFAVSDIPSFDDDIDSVDTNKVSEQKTEVKPAQHKQFNAVQSWASTLLDDDADSETDDLPRVSTTVDKNVQATSGEGTPKIINSSIALDDTDFDANDDNLKVINNKAFDMSDEDALGDELNTLLQKAQDMRDEEPETFTDMFRKASNQQNINNGEVVNRVTVDSEDVDSVDVDNKNVDRVAVDKATLERAMKENSPIDEYSTDFTDSDTDTEEISLQKQTQKPNVSAPDFSRILADNDNEVVDNDFDDDSDLLRFSSKNKTERIPNDVSTLQKMFAEANAKDDVTRNANSQNPAPRNTVENTVIPNDLTAFEIDDVDIDANNVDLRPLAQYTQQVESTQQSQLPQQPISSQQTTSPSEQSNVIGFDKFVDIDNDNNDTEAQSIFNKTPNNSTSEQIINNQANKELANKEQIDVKSPLDRAFASRIMELDEGEPTSLSNSNVNASTNEMKKDVNTPNISASVTSETTDNQNSDDDSQKVSTESQQKPRSRQLFSFLNNKEPNRENNVGNNAGISKEPNVANNRENSDLEGQNVTAKIQPSWSNGVTSNTNSEVKEPSLAISPNNTERPSLNNVERTAQNNIERSIQNNVEIIPQNTTNTETTSQRSTVTNSPNTTQNVSVATTENQKDSVASNTVNVDIDDDFSNNLDDDFSQKLGSALAQNLDEDLPNKPDASALQKLDTDSLSKALSGENHTVSKSPRNLANSLAEISEREKNIISNRYNAPNYATEVPSKYEESAPVEVAEPKGVSRFINKFSKLTNLFSRNTNKATDNGNTVKPDTPEQIEHNKFRNEASILSNHNVTNNFDNNAISNNDILSNSTSTGTEVSSVASHTPSADLKSVSMEDMIRSLSSIMNDGKITPEIKEMAGSIHQAMTNPLGDLVAVSEWLGLVNAPLTSTGSRARSMQQWALMLLSIRFRQLGKNIDKFVQTEPFRQMLKNMSLGENDKWPNNALNHTLQQVERMQQLSSDQEYGIPQFIPLPPSYDGGREGGLNVEHHKKEDGEMEWRLNFFFELPKLGPIQVRSSLQVPDVKLSIVTEKLEALQKVKETSNVLMNRLGDYGFKVAPLSARIGTIYPPAPRRTSTATSDNRSSYSNKDGLSVNI